MMTQSDPFRSLTEPLREVAQQHLTLDHIMHFELRSSLLDCALTLVMTALDGPGRVTIKHSGVVADLFLSAVACMRAVIDARPLPPDTWAAAISRRKHIHALQEWQRALTGLELRQENAVMRYLVVGEHVQEWLCVPVIDEIRWRQRLSIGAHEQPSAVVVRTDRQMLLVRETKRVVLGQAMYGNDVFVMPLQWLRTIGMLSRQRGAEMQFALEHRGVTAVVRLPIPPALAERALEFVTSSLTTH